MKGIKISLKITTLVILISLVAVGAISFFTYDFNLKTNREKITNNLFAITENRGALVNTYFEKIAYKMAVLQGASELKGESSAAPADLGFDMDMGTGEQTDSAAAEEPSASPIEIYLHDQKDAFGFDQIYLTSKTGAIDA